MNYFSFWGVYLLSIFCFATVAQDMPDDFLSKSFHKERRTLLREKLPANSVAVFFSNPIRNRANDVDFVYHQDPNFYYLTGYMEPHSMLLIFKENHAGHDGKLYNEILFTQPRNAFSEMWTGRRLGSQGAKDKLGFVSALDNTNFKQYNIDFSTFDTILFYDFSNDVKDDEKNDADLYDLITLFKTKVNYPREGQITVALEKGKNNLDINTLDGYMQALRGVKTEDELALIQRAIQISCQGQIEVMKAISPNMSEREIQGIHEFVFKKYQAEDVGYPSIVGAGHNGCILHYINNYKPNVSSTELILMDLGAEYRGYTADITRTIPISGTFSKDQKTIYDIVLKAQEAAMKVCRPGTSFSELTKVTRQTVNTQLAKLDIIDSKDARHTYYPHGCCHHIGLDVHDKGIRKGLEKNMTFTIEPGIYIPEDSPCDKRWWGIAVRIEDDYVVTEKGCKLLSSSAPRTTKAIEAMMAQPSPLDKFVLPTLTKEKKKTIH